MPCGLRLACSALFVFPTVTAHNNYNFVLRLTVLAHRLTGTSCMRPCLHERATLVRAPERMASTNSSSTMNSSTPLQQPWVRATGRVLEYPGSSIISNTFKVLNSRPVLVYMYYNSIGTPHSAGSWGVEYHHKIAPRGRWTWKRSATGRPCQAMAVTVSVSALT